MESADFERPHSHETPEQPAPSLTIDKLTTATLYLEKVLGAPALLFPSREKLRVHIVIDSGESTPALGFSATYSDLRGLEYTNAPRANGKVYLLPDAVAARMELFLCLNVRAFTIAPTGPYEVMYHVVAYPV